MRGLTASLNPGWNSEVHVDLPLVHTLALRPGYDDLPDGPGLPRFTMSTPPAAPAHVMEANVRSFQEGSLELSLVVACVRGWSDTSPARQIEGRLAASPDWSLLQQEAETHGVFPVVYAQLARVRQLIPLEVWSRLSRANEENVRRSLMLSGELIRALQILEATGVPAIPFKGPALAAAVYGDVALRQYSDLDILIRPSDWPRAREALVRAGYAPEYSVSGRREQALLATGYECAFIQEKLRSIVELQWALLPRFYAVHTRIDQLFARARFADWQGHRLRVLDSHDLLLAVSVHAAKHLWRRLAWLLDVVQIVRTQTLDWNLVRARAREWGVERMALTGFALAHRLLDAELPVPVAGWLGGDPAAAALAEKISQHIVQNRHLDPESLSYFRLISKLRERPSDRAKFFWRLAVTPSFGEWLAVRLPDGLFACYRGVRIARLARRALTRKG